MSQDTWILLQFKSKMLKQIKYMVFILDVWIFSSVSAIMSLLKLLIVCGTGLGLLLVIMMSRQYSVDDL